MFLIIIGKICNTNTQLINFAIDIQLLSSVIFISSAAIAHYGIGSFYDLK